MDVVTYLLADASGEGAGQFKVGPDPDGFWILMAIGVWLALGWIFVCNVLSGNLF